MLNDYTKPIEQIPLALMYDPLEKPIAISFSSSNVEQIQQLLHATGKRCLFKLDLVSAPDETGERTIRIELIPV